MKGQEILDVQKILDSRSAIVKDYSKFLSSGIKSAFTGSALIDWLLNNYNPTHTTREGLVQLVKEELFSPSLPLQDANQCKAFFINIYNVMNIHALIARYRKEKKLELHLLQRPLFYAQFKYNIGGQTYSLSDIEQGILRKNSALAHDITSTVMEF